MPMLSERRWREQAEKRLALLKARIAIVARARAPQRWVFGHASDRVWFDANAAGYRRYPSFRRLLPGFPEEETQRGFVGAAGDHALREAFDAYTSWRDACARHGLPLGRDSRVLDFGCGWGRLLRLFLREVAPENLLGVDVLDQAIELCRQINPWCRFERIEPLPPIALSDQSFDLIYLFSVFSHLSEDAHAAWLAEFHRLLRPGGLLIATTRPRAFIEWCAAVRQGTRTPTHVELLRTFVETQAWLARYDRGEFCHDSVGGGEVLSSSFYGETCIPEAYVRRRWTAWFEISNYVEASSDGIWQDVIVARRPR